MACTQYPPTFGWELPHPMASFTELDFYNLSSLLAEDDLMVRDMVRSYCTDKLMPIVAEHWEAGTFPTPVIKEMGELGLLGPSVAEEYGGAGMSAIQYGIICQEIERVDSGLRSFNSVQGSLVMYPVEAFGSEEQKKEWLPKLASGDAVGCFGLTEPDFGSDPAGMRTRCRRDGDDWILDGQKMWITNGSMADMAIVWAKDDEGIVQGFIVETEREGFSAPEQKH
ncbi:MAG: acyl-CoA dehydrogenase family protein, partial [Planctomycetota bacterium]|nr:acyl-CoA dehydrogenase family protein [Planctomycetota bacterium]